MNDRIEQIRKQYKTNTMPRDIERNERKKAEHEKMNQQ